MEKAESCYEFERLSNEKPAVIKQWLPRQSFWQLRLPPLKHVDRTHYEVMIPNEMHQFDLLQMPSIMLYKNNYEYILSRIDITSRYNVASRPMLTKQSADVAHIYKVGPFTYPKTFQCDNGSKFKAEVTKMLHKHGVMTQHTKTKYKHTQTAFFKDLNKLCAGKLFKVQDVQ